MSGADDYGTVVPSQGYSYKYIEGSGVCVTSSMLWGGNATGELLVTPVLIFAAREWARMVWDCETVRGFYQPVHFLGQLTKHKRTGRTRLKFIFKICPRSLTNRLRLQTRSQYTLK